MTHLRLPLLNQIRRGKVEHHLRPILRLKTSVSSVKRRDTWIKIFLNLISGLRRNVITPFFFFY